jgi:outer membrane lipoprotein-sorting protein
MKTASCISFFLPVLRRNRLIIKNFFFLCLIASCFLSGCAGLREKISPVPPPASVEAQALIASVKDKNQNLTNFKGIGKITLWNKNKFQTTRVAWLGSYPGKLRIEALSVSGQPLASIAGDGEWFYYRNYKDFYKKRSTDPSLQKIVAIPVTSGDIVEMLSGRIPVREHHSASLAKDKSGYILTLQSKWGGVPEKIFWDETKSLVRKIEMFNTFGTLEYRAEFGLLQTVNSYPIPFQIVLSNDEDMGFQLDISKCWTGITIPPSKFVLTPPDDNQ